MPNWSFNTLFIEADSKTVDKIISDIKGDEGEAISFKKIIPIHSDLFCEVAYGGGEDAEKKREEIYAQNKAKHGFPHWYEACVELWGTKWDAGEVNHEVINDKWHRIDFQTAWSPPVPVIIALSKQFPEAKFTMECQEESGEFSFVAEFKGGEKISETQIPWSGEEEGE
jgi:hypothetical protein